MERYRKRWTLLLLVLLVTGCATVLVHPTDEDVRWARQRWPEITREELERGRALYVRKCAGCHNLHRPDEYPPEAWPDLVAKMQDEAEIGAVEVERIGKYLSTASAHLAAEHSR